MKVKSLLIGIVGGVVIAGATTLLSTPSSGRDLRIRLQSKKEELLATGVELLTALQAIKNDTVTATQTSKESLKLFVSDVQLLIKDWQTDIEPYKQELMKSVQEIEASLKELEEIIPD